MATQLTIVNSVLRRLREDTVASVNDNAYAQLIAMFVNDGMREVQEAYDWDIFRHTIKFDTVADDATYDLSATVAEGGDVYNTDTTTTIDSLLRYDAFGRPMFYLYDDSSEDVPGAMPHLVSADELVRYRNMDRGETQEWPMVFAIGQQSDGDGLKVTMYPAPNSVKYCRINFWTPQAELAIDGTDDNTDIKAPRTPIEAYAHMTAANERGEEIGEPGNLLERRYQFALGAAIEAAMQPDARANRYESWRD